MGYKHALPCPTLYGCCLSDVGPRASVAGALSTELAVQPGVFGFYSQRNGRCSLIFDWVLIVICGLFKENRNFMFKKRLWYLKGLVFYNLAVRKKSCGCSGPLPLFLCGLHTSLMDVKSSAHYLEYVRQDKCFVGSYYTALFRE